MRMHNHKRIPTEKIPKNKKTAFYSGILSISLFGVLALPATLSAFTYDDYLLATEKTGKTIADGIIAGKNNTTALYGAAWNELASQGPTLRLPKVGPLVASYVESSNNLGQTFANTLTQGMGASHDLSQKMWNTDPYGHLTANVADTFDSVVNYFGSFFKKTPSPVPPTTPTPTPKLTTPKPPTPPVVAKPTVTPTPQPTKNYKPLTTNSSPPPPQSTQVIVQRVLSGITGADLELKIQQLRNELVSTIGQVAGQSQSNYNNNFAAIALTNKIDQLTNTTITTPTLS